MNGVTAKKTTSKKQPLSLNIQEAANGYSANLYRGEEFGRAKNMVFRNKEDLIAWLEKELK